MTDHARDKASSTTDLKNVPADVHAFLRGPLRMIVGGKEHLAQATSHVDVVYPATGKTIAHVDMASESDAQLAIEAARRAFDFGFWPRMHPRERSVILHRLADRVEQSGEIFAVLETLHTGKPISESIGDIARAVDGLRFYAASARMARGETIPLSPELRAQTVLEPLGVVAAIIPWNAPLVLAVSKAAPALAVGNTVVAKPAAQTPLTALLLARMARDSGMPDGVFNVVTGGSALGEILTRHQLIDGITFTGSTASGEKVGAVAARTHKRMQLELGGKSPHIIFADAELPKAIAAAASGIFYGAGQICSAGSRLYVEASVFDEVVDGVIRVAETLRIGDPMNRETQLGSLISVDHRSQVIRHIDMAIRTGARVATGGEPPSPIPGFEGGAFMTPTVLTQVNAASPAAREEIFGPVLVAAAFRSEEEALALANDTRYGLGAGVWSASAARSHRVARRLRTGVVWLNTYNQFDPSVPFGGIKASGGGSREWSHLAMDNFLETKTIWEGA